MSSTSHSTTPGSSTFIKSCFGSSHIGLINSNAGAWNHLSEGNPTLCHQPLPYLEPYETGETFRVMQSDHACSTLPIVIKSEENDSLAEGDCKQLGLNPHPPTDNVIQHAMIEDPAMCMDVKMFIQPLTHIPSLPLPFTSEGPYNPSSSQSMTIGAQFNTPFSSLSRTATSTDFSNPIPTNPTSKS